MKNLDSLSRNEMKRIQGGFNPWLWLAAGVAYDIYSNPTAFKNAVKAGFNQWN